MTKNPYDHDWFNAHAETIVKIISDVLTDSVSSDTKREALNVLTKGDVSFEDGQFAYDTEQVGGYKVRAAIAAEIDRLIINGSPLNAVRLLRETMKIGVKEAKDAIDTRRHKLELRNKIAKIRLKEVKDAIDTRRHKLELRNKIAQSQQV